MGTASASIENGSPLGVITAANTTMSTMAQRRHDASFRGDKHADELERHQDDGELEGEPEHRHERHDQAEVLVGVVDLLQRGSADVLQELQGVGERHEGQHAPKTKSTIDEPRRTVRRSASRCGAGPA